MIANPWAKNSVLHCTLRVADVKDISKMASLTWKTSLTSVLHKTGHFNPVPVGAALQGVGPEESRLPWQRLPRALK